MISPILPAHDATTVALDFGVFVAEHARTFRTSQTAIIAALLPSIIPSQTFSPSQAPAAPTSTNAPVDVQAEGADASLSADPLPPAKAPTRRDVLRALVVEYPNETATQLASRMGIDASNIRAIARQIGIALPKTRRALKVQPAPKRPAVAEALQKVVEVQKAAIALKVPTRPKPKPADKAAPRVTTVQRVRDLHVEHPDWSHRQFCAALPNANPQTISVELSKIRAAQRVVEDAETQRRLIAEARERENAPAAEQGDKRTLTDRVRAIHAQHSNWTARLIAIELGANPNSVSALLAGIRNPKAASAPEKPEFTGRREMVEHYGAIAKRLGKPS